MKKLFLFLILCLACFGGLEAQIFWKPIGMQGIFLGAGPDGSLYSYSSSANGPCITRSLDEGETWQVVVGYETGFNCNLNWNCFSVSPKGRMFLFEGYPYRAFYSDDGGYSWQLTSGAAPLIAGDEAQQICAVNNDTLVGVAGSPYVFWTTDGGITWDTIRPAFIEDDQYIGDILANGNGDVYFSLNLNSGGNHSQNIGVYHASLSDMSHWELVAFQGVAINDMEFDPEGNVVCNALVGVYFGGFEHVPGFYAFGSYNTFGISDNGIVFTSNVTENNTAVLAYSLDHGETFSEIGEELALEPPVPGGRDGYLSKGYDNHLYFKGRGVYWKSIVDADKINNFSGYFPLVYEGDGRQDWNVVYIITGSAYPDVYHTDIQSIHDDITLDDVDYRLVWTGNELCESIVGAVREEGQRVYYRRYTPDGYEDEVLLYDFNLTVGDTVTVNWGNTTLLVLEESEVEVDGTMRRQLGLGNPDNGVSPFSEVDEYWIEGVGSTHGFLNSGHEPWSWFGSFDHLLCYYENGNLIWDNGEFDECVMNSETEPFAVGDLLYEIISTEPPCVSVVGHVNGTNATGQLVIPESVTYNGNDYVVIAIGDYAFESCVGLSGALTIPNSVITIGLNAFTGCTGFRSLTLGNSVTTIGLAAFYGCTGFAGTLTIPDSVNDVMSHAFANCTGFTGTLVAGNGLTRIEDALFSGCTGFTGLDLGNSVTSIGTSAFYGCTGFTGSLTIPNSVVIIEASAFRNCSGFTGTLTLGDSLESIDGVAFGNCSGFDEVVSLATVPPEFLHGGVFSGISCTKLIVPCGCKTAYENSGWHGYFPTIIEDCGLIGAEWYYEIENGDGSITYQHLEYAADTTVNNKDVVIIIRTNTLYDKGGHTEVTREYVYAEDGIVYWWNSDLQEFTVLYNYEAQVGDAWEIKVGTESVTVHVDAVEMYEYEGRVFRMLRVSDAEDVFSGNIVDGIGHLTSFFPERLMTRGKGYRVEGMRCYWRDGELFFKYGEEDCDAVYKEWHNGIGEDGPSTDTETFAIYPNPTHGVLVVETRLISSQPNEYRITNLMGQTLMTGTLTTETQQIDVSNLPQGMYFISVGNTARKFVVDR